MYVIKVPLGVRSYTISIGSRLLARVWAMNAGVFTWASAAW